MKSLEYVPEVYAQFYHLSKGILKCYLLTGEINKKRALHHHLDASAHFRLVVDKFS